MSRTCLAVPWSLMNRCLFVAALFLLPGGLALAQEVVKVEEDWEMVLGEPDVNSVGPQVAVTMSPLGDIASTFFTLEINHRSAPYWTPGGLTIHQWDGESRVQSLDRSDRTVMNTSGETVTWTQVLRVDLGWLTFKIKDGSSSTWGSFGTSSNFKLISWWGGDNLNGYTPDVSVGQTGVAYAGNRVHSLKIKQIRVTLSDGTVVTDDTVRVAHQLVE